jgi:alkylated DNA repair protein (DNA oxidative demethylase)
VSDAVLQTEFELTGAGAVPAAPAQPSGYTLLRGLAAGQAGTTLLSRIADIASRAPFRQMQTPGGFTMSAAMTNCGRLGWITDRRGYRYVGIDPVSGERWPEMPDEFRTLAADAAARAGFADFVPDACLVNRYAVGARMSLHQDRNERDFSAPIVSVSLGLPATFLWGGKERQARAQRIPLVHGDVVVWGGAARLRFHGVLPVAAGEHPATGACRYNLTFRVAG